MKAGKKPRLTILVPLIFSLLLGTGCGRSNPPEATKKARPFHGKIKKVALSKAILRVDKATLLPVRGVKVAGFISQGALKGIDLLFIVNRESLPRLRPPHFELNLSNAQILELDPGRPIYVEVSMKHAPLETANQCYRKTRHFLEVLKLKDTYGFPLILDLENYKLKKWLVETERHIKVIK